MTVILPVITAVTCMIGLLLMLRDADEQKKVPEENLEAPQQPEKPSRQWPMWVYAAFCSVLTVVIAVFFPKIYSENSVWVNVKRMVLLAVIWPVAYIDFKTMRIPNVFIIFGLVCRGIILIFELLLQNPYVWQDLLAEVVASAALLLASVLCSLVVKNGIGFGDMKLFIVMGLMLGLTGIWGAIFVSLIVSFFISVFVLITKKKTRKDAIPFGPALVIGTYLSVFLTGM